MLVPYQWQSMWYKGLTKQGKMYLYDNPYLFNPVNWSKWAAIAGIVTALIALTALVIGCVAILR